MRGTSAQARMFKFATYEVDRDSGEFYKSGVRQKLAGQPFEVLCLLLERPNQIVTREEFQERIWSKDTFVDYDLALRKAIARLRESLGDCPENPRFIETIPRKGYRFIAAVGSNGQVAGEMPVAFGQVARSHNSPDVAAQPLASGQIPAQELSVYELGNAAPSIKAFSGLNWSRNARVLLLLLLLLLVLIAIVATKAFYLGSSHRRALTDSDTIILADFTNTTGDSVFDDTLKETLSVELQESSFLHQISDRKVNHTLKLMGKSAGVRLSPELTQQVCLRNEGKAMLIGSIGGLGKEYVISLKAITCDSGDLLAEEQVEAKNKEGVLRAVHDAAVTLRRKLGEALVSVNRHTIVLEEASTPSLEALQAYSLGQQTTLAKGWAAGIPFFMRSLELDPNFARAYVAISGSYANLGQMERAAEYSRKAFDLRGNVSDGERFAIETFYYAFVTGELEKAVEVCEQWHQMYPKSAVALTDLAAAEVSLGRHKEGLEHGYEALQLEPQGQTYYLAVGSALVFLDRFQEAETLYSEADRRKLDAEGFAGARYRLAFLKADPERMSTLLATAIGKPGIEHRVLALQAETEAWYGRFESARDFTRRASTSAVQNDVKEKAAIYEAILALWEAEIGERDRATARIRSAARKSSGRNARPLQALVLARSGAIIEAEKMAAELDEQFSHDTLMQRYWLPSIRAAIKLSRKEPLQALQILEQSNGVELSAAVWPPLAPAYLRGQAYLMVHDGPGAAEEFRKLIVHRGLVANSQLGVLSRIGLASALRLDGDLAASRTEYQEFLNLWKDADPDLPILVRARSEYAKMR
jgi:DNA-binding winged helix-turn-helix (wHTH) protein/tetratricopeptide (TPR) repeat protein